jgi:tetratricopeptide (TPR) repeat protein
VGDEPFSQFMDIVKEELGKRAYIALVVLLLVSYLIFQIVAHPDIIVAVIAAACCVPAWLWYVWASYRKRSSRNLVGLILILAILSTGAWAIWLARDLTSTKMEIAKSLNGGEDSLRDKDYASTEKHFEDARDLAKTSKSYKDEQVESLFLLAQAQIYSGQGSPEQVKKAQDNLESSFDLAGDNLNMKARVRIAQAELASDNDQARQYLSEALEISGKMKVHDSSLDAIIFRAQGDLENKLLNHDQAIIDYRKAGEAYGVDSIGVPFWRRVSGWIHGGRRGGDNRQGQADVLLGLGDVELNVGHMNDARRDYAQAAQLYHDVHQRREEAYALMGLGDTDRILNNFENARKSYGSAEGLFYNDKHGEASVPFALGEIERELGNTDAALWDYQRALEFYGAAKMDQANVLVGRAELETELGDYDDARNDLKAAGDLSRGAGDPLGEAMGWEAKKDEARDYYGRARVIYGKNADKLGEADILLGLGKLESRFGDPKAAHQDFDDAYALYEIEEIPLDQADVLYNRAELERKEKKYKLAGPNYQAARKIYEKDPQDICKFGVANVLLGLGDLARAQGNPGEARGDYDQARRMYEEEKSLIGQANVDLSESMLPDEKSVEALDNLNKAKKMYSQMGKSDKVGEVQQQLNKYRGIGLLNKTIGTSHAYSAV